MEFLFLIGFGQGVFLIFVLIANRRNSLANKILAFWVSLISISLFLNFSYESGNIAKYAHLIGLDHSFPFLYGPLLYIYTIALTKMQVLNWKIQWPHFIPFLFHSLFVLVIFYNKSGTYKMEFLRQLQLGNIPPDILWVNALKFVQAAIYISLTLRILGIYRQTIANEFSYLEKINLRWLSTITWILAGIYALKTMAFILFLRFESFNLGLMEGLTELGVIVLVFVIAYFGYSQPEVFSTLVLNHEIFIPKRNLDINIESKEEIKPKYVQSNLSLEFKDKLLKELFHAMENQKLYLNPGLTILSLAESLSVSAKDLSQILNGELGKNFFNFINEYRVNEIKSRMLSDDFKHLSILGIAFDCGFSSKSAFHEVFKKLTNQTPKEYIDSVSIKN